MLDLKLFTARQILYHPRFYRPIKKLLNWKVGTSIIGTVELWAMDAISHSRPDEMQDFQIKRFRRILDYAIKNVPFWQKQFNKNCPEIRNYDDIRKIPVMKRSDVNATPEMFVSAVKNPELSFKMTTSGSTGEPMTFYVDRDIFYRRAFSLRHSLKIFGENPWSNILRLNYKDMPWSVCQGFYIDLLESKKNPDFLYKIIKQYQYEALYGTVSHLILFAELIRNKWLNHQFDFILSRSEYLDLNNRRHLESTFKCPVFNIYASREFGPLGQSCSKNYGFHLNDDRFLIEIVDENGKPIHDGMSGKIVVTSFDNEIMPFIRYEIGDIGRFLPPCNCGVRTRKIALEGRACDFIYLSDNSKFPLIQLLHIINLPEAVKAYQIVQKNIGSLIIKLVPGIHYNNEIGNNMIEKIIKKTEDKELRLNIQLVNNIEILKNGKSRLFISEINK